MIIALSEASAKKKGWQQVKAHIPYRDGTLTRLLKHALGGNCHTLMVACVSPCDAHAEENASTLAYATRARAISNTPKINVDPHAAQARHRHRRHRCATLSCNLCASSCHRRRRRRRCRCCCWRCC